MRLEEMEGLCEFKEAQLVAEKAHVDKLEVCVSCMLVGMLAGTLLSVCVCRFVPFSLSLSVCMSFGQCVSFSYTLSPFLSLSLCLFVSLTHLSPQTYPWHDPWHCGRQGTKRSEGRSKPGPKERAREAQGSTRCCKGEVGRSCGQTAEGVCSSVISISVH